MKASHPIRYLLLYIPFALAWVFSHQAHASYLIAWLGSFFIFYLSYSNIIKELPKDMSRIEQLMRPIFLTHIIFAGYLCCTSIFYYLNTLGYEYSSFIGRPMMIPEETYQNIAQCQRYYVLGHAALVHGLLAGMRYPIEKKYDIQVGSMSNLLLALSVICLPLGYMFGKIGALSQFSNQLSGLSFVAGTIALAFAIREQKRTNFWFAGVLFVLNLYNSFISGFKEPIIICVLLLGVFLLPLYGKKIVPIFGILLVGLFFILPSFINNFRKLANEGVDVTEARDKSFDAILNSDQQGLQEDNWEFLVYRISEIDMFMTYTQSTPRYIPFYKLELVKNGLSIIPPRILWPGKPNVESLIMQRVYQAGVVDRNSMVSAKPAYIVDTYLSYGVIGIWIGLFLYGYAAQWISTKAEELFGGYFLGSAVMFAGLFQVFWRGNSIEFLFGAVFWSFVTMLIIFNILKARGILVAVN